MFSAFLLYSASRKIFNVRGHNFIFNVKLNLYNRPFYIKNLNTRVTIHTGFFARPKTLKSVPTLCMKFAPLRPQKIINVLLISNNCAT